MTPRTPPLLGLLLRVLPREFRDRFGNEMTAAFEARLEAARARGRGAATALWMRTTVDLLRTASAEWTRLVVSPSGWLEDARVSTRSLWRTPSFTLIAAGTIALGIGANTAVFSVVRAVLIAPLPVQNSGELHRLFSYNDQGGQAEYFVSPGNLLTMEAEATTLRIGGWIPSEGTILMDDGTPMRITSLATTADLLPLLGIEPAVGRIFGPDDAAGANGNASVLISWAMWQSQFGADPRILERTLNRPGGGTLEILGVLPEGLDVVLPEADVITPLQNLSQNPALTERWLSAVIRVPATVGIEAARSELAAMALRFEETDPASNLGWRYQTTPLETLALGEARSALGILLAASALVLLIACANVANLLLARAEARERSVALRSALGASGARIYRLLAAESTILAFAGASVGVLMAWLGLDVLVGLGAAEMPRLDQAQLDGPVLIFTVAVTALTGLACGLVPALRLRGVDLSAVLRDGSRGSGNSRARERVRGSFVVAQLALSVVLVATAGLLLRNFVGVIGSDPGFRSSNLITAELTLNNAAYAEFDAVEAFYTQWTDRASQLPGVSHATLSTSVPFGPNWDYPVAMEPQGSEQTDPNLQPRALNRMVDVGFFEALGVPILAGRSFERTDDVGGEGVVILNEAAARFFFPGESAIGKRFINTAGPYGPLGETRKDEVRVIGIAQDMKYAGLAVAAEPAVYFPFRQAPFRRMTLLVRTSGEPAATVAGIRRELAAMDGSLAVSRVGTVSDMVYRSMARERLSSSLLGLFAVLALVLASVGIYGVLSQAVAQRLNEIGVRRALGADSGRVARLILRRTLWLTGLGLGLGLTGALAAGRALAGELTAIGPRDPFVMGGVVLVLGVVAVAASVAPLLRALSVDPAKALRAE